MQVTETKNEGLSREFAITIPAADIEERVDARLRELTHQVKLPGFRPGKVPVKIVRQRFGNAVMGEVLQDTVAETSSQALADRELKPAVQPKIEIKTFEEGKDLEFTLAVDVLPVIEPMDFRTLELERLKAQIDDKQVEDALDRMAADFTSAEPIKEARAAQSGDILVIDFKGFADDKPIESGSGDDYSLELGSGRFIPGIEEKLVGAKAGEHVRAEVKFPEDYGNPELAGKEAVFEIEVKEIREKVKATIDDAFAKSLGAEDLTKLKQRIRARLESEYAGLGRERLKRKLLDQLDEHHGFEVPKGMVDSEFDSIWKQFETAKKNNQLAPEDFDKDEEELRADYRKIAERRVRLGLLLAAVGQRSNITVTPEETNRALIRQAQSFPGQEKKIIDLYRNNENLMASLRAPIFEDKVIDYILEMAQVSEREVSVEELLHDPDASEEASDSTAKTASKGGKKKSGSKRKAAGAGKDT